jgi:hypothetical protein
MYGRSSMSQYGKPITSLYYELKVNLGLGVRIPFSLQ